ncbi:histidine--tRNA ligase [Candidatus Dojkabacteria bacterium]|uniref:Histidine--tRNA ligase n=1 Tax=Candidatus Dojkabacteria bacterium TaxID=2099670 RepID=A0A3M0Z1X1_9BACT|nr:MAG: histidine--tRNA ligase [Candidatus Dojkabacteria bacterium]
MKLSNLPPKGTQDWFPDEYAKRKFIFDGWRKVCESYGFKEYLTPMIEYSEIYKAKSGEDVGGVELTTFFDRGGRELAIRPEMTPSVTRMVTRVFEHVTKPIKLFSIANFFRNQRPQKGRNREFWQLNVDVFGSDSVYCDIEMIVMSIEIMRSFGAKQNDFVILYNHRQYVKRVLQEIFLVPDDKLNLAIRILDKFWKIPHDEFLKRLRVECDAKFSDEDFIVNFCQFGFQTNKSMSSSLGIRLETDFYKHEEKFFTILKSLAIQEFLIYDPTLVRGLDYYDGMIFEIFDRNLLLKRHGRKFDGEVIDRSIFGGGRYNGLSSIFGAKSFPAVGFAVGDETFKLFLETKKLLPPFNSNLEIFLPILSSSLAEKVFILSSKLRSESKNVLIGLEVMKIDKAIDFCLKNDIPMLAILGENEVSRGVYKLKDLASKVEKEFPF